MLQNGRTEDRTIRNLLDLHKFMPDNRLAPLTEAVGKKYGLHVSRRTELSDEEIEVWAAGDWASGLKPDKVPGDTDE